MLLGYSPRLRSKTNYPKGDCGEPIDANTSVLNIIFTYDSNKYFYFFGLLLQGKKNVEQNM